MLTCCWTGVAVLMFCSLSQSPGEIPTRKQHPFRQLLLAQVLTSSTRRTTCSAISRREKDMMRSCLMEFSCLYVFTYIIIVPKKDKKDTMRSYMMDLAPMELVIWERTSDGNLSNIRSYPWIYELCNPNLSQCSSWSWRNNLIFCRHTRDGLLMNTYQGYVLIDLKNPKYNILFWCAHT